MVLSNRKAETIVSFLSFISHTEATLRFSHNYYNHRHLNLEQCKLQKNKKIEKKSKEITSGVSTQIHALAKTRNRCFHQYILYHQHSYTDSALLQRRIHVLGKHFGSKK